MPVTTPYVLMLENDSDDRYITQSTVDELGLPVQLKFDVYSDALISSLVSDAPSLILLGYNTLPETGIRILRRFKDHPALAHIPVVILSEDISSTHIREYYRHGANSVVKKPSSVFDTRHKVSTFFNYWLEVAET